MPIASNSKLQGRASLTPVHRVLLQSTAEIARNIFLVLQYSLSSYKSNRLHGTQPWPPHGNMTPRPESDSF